ncbi:hypothetical protein HMPREF2690_00025 [Corynebacterium sp. HMSC034E11]|uniref:CDP-glycerol glycerophosphotransferase family protein n=1 Tax=Corynebacterium sp. HMSC034E11 TaxID=1715169 RepID=UPI0008A8E329|nr:CDP-glycerol glycerophosphotransferase family protein [Corynebacterium sp. HMSC034E11]OHO35760.1 hypothetical protein HMPREF2690_00025 [Corynebacterium sp. HMSC034E11]
MKTKKSFNQQGLRDKVLRFSGGVIAGKTGLPKLQKVVQYSAAKTYADGNLKEALHLYESIPEELRSTEVKVRISKIYGELGNLDLAIAKINALEMDGVSSGAYKELKASLLEQKNDLETRQNKNDPRSGSSFSYLESVAREKGLSALVLEDHRRLLQQRMEGEQRFVVNLAGELVIKHPKDPIIRFEYAVALYESGQLLRARSNLIALDAIKVDDDVAVRARSLMKAIAEGEAIAKFDLAGLLVKNDLLYEEIQPQERDTSLNHALTSWERLELLYAVEDPSPALEQVILAELIRTRRFKMAYELLQEKQSTGEIDMREAFELCKCELVLAGEVSEKALFGLNEARKKAGKRPIAVNELYSQLGDKRSAYRLASKDEYIKPNEAWWWDRYSRLASYNGEKERATAAAIMAAELDRSTQRHFRAGVVADQNEQFDLAAEQYALAVANKNDKSVSRLHLGISYWRATADAATALMILEPFWSSFDFGQTLATRLKPEQYRIGEKEQQIDGLVSGQPENDLLRKISSTQAKFSLADQVKLILPKIGLNTDKTAKINSVLFTVAIRDLRAGNVKSAEKAFWKLAFMMEEHDPAIFEALGYCSAVLGDLDRAMKLFVISEELPTSYLYEVGKPNQRKRNVYRYLELREFLDILPGVWLWESHFGRRIDCNPLAVYREVQQRGLRDQLHVWVANEGTEIPDDVALASDTVVCRRESPGYWLALAVAKYLCNNASFSFEYMHREGQVSVNTWHGTPLKFLGRDDKDALYDYGNVSRNFLHCTQLQMPNDFTADVMKRSYEVDNFLGGEVLVTGYPRNDALMHVSPGAKQSLRNKIGCKTDLPLILYAPTWRGTPKSQKAHIEKLIKDLAVLGADEGFEVVFRGHPLSQKALDEVEIPVLVPPAELSTYDLIAAADVVITDYSSLGVDALAGSAPVLFYVYDYEDYRSDRGLYFDKADFPGPTYEDLDSLISGIQRSLDLAVEGKTSTRDVFVRKEDGKAAERCLDLMLRDDGDIEQLKPTKKTMFLHNAFSSGSNRGDVIQFLSSLDPSIWDVTVSLDSATIDLDPGMVQALDALPDHVRVLPRKGGLVNTAEEYVAVNSLYQTPWVGLNDYQLSLYTSSLKREHFRLFHKQEFDVAIKWGPESTFWTAFIALGVKATNTVYVNTVGDQLYNYEVRPELRRANQFIDHYDSYVDLEKGQGLEELGVDFFGPGTGILREMK